MTSGMIAARSLEPLARPPLLMALVQARFAPVPALEDLAAIDEITQSLPYGWQLRARHTAREMHVTISNDGVKEVSGALETVSVWWADGDDGLRAAVSPTSVAVECDHYTAWPRMHDALTSVFRAAAPHIGGGCQRFGVRYINEIRDPRAGGSISGLGELINSDLIGAAAALGEPLLGSLQEIRTGEPEGGELAVRHGLRDPGTYLLDYDRYSTTEQPFDASVLAALGEQYHDRIEAVFAWSLSDSYLAELQQPETEESGG